MRGEEQRRGWLDWPETRCQSWSAEILILPIKLVELLRRLFGMRMDEKMLRCLVLEVENGSMDRILEIEF